MSEISDRRKVTKKRVILMLEIIDRRKSNKKRGGVLMSDISDRTGVTGQLPLPCPLPSHK